MRLTERAASEDESDDDDDESDRYVIEVVDDERHADTPDRTDFVMRMLSEASTGGESSRSGSNDTDFIMRMLGHAGTGDESSQSASDATDFVMRMLGQGSTGGESSQSASDETDYVMRMARQTNTGGESSRVPTHIVASILYDGMRYFTNDHARALKARMVKGLSRRPSSNGVQKRKAVLKAESTLGEVRLTTHVQVTFSLSHAPGRRADDYGHPDYYFALRFTLFCKRKETNHHSSAGKLTISGSVQDVINSIYDEGLPAFVFGRTEEVFSRSEGSPSVESLGLNDRIVRAMEFKVLANLESIMKDLVSSKGRRRTGKKG